MKFLAKLYYKPRSYIISKVKLSTKRQIEVTDINIQGLYEDNRSFPNDADLKRKSKIFNMMTYKIVCVIQKLTLFLFPKLAEVSRG